MGDTLGHELTSIAEELRSLSARDRAVRAAAVWRQLADVQSCLAEVRRMAVREMRTELTLEKVAEELGISLARVKQIIADRRE